VKNREESFVRPKGVDQNFPLIFHWEMRMGRRKGGDKAYGWRAGRKGKGKKANGGNPKVDLRPKVGKVAPDFDCRFGDRSHLL